MPTQNQIEMEIQERGEILEKIIHANKTNVQSVLFNVNKWTVDKAKKWLAEHDYKHDKVDTTEQYHRFRQFDPSVESSGFGFFYFIMMRQKSQKEIELVLCDGELLSEQETEAIAQLIAKWIFQDLNSKEIENVSITD